MDIIAGIVLGGTVGLLIGLSSSPVAASVISALVALAVTFLGFGDKAKPLPISSSPQRLVSFCLGLIACLTVGIDCRSHGWLGPQPADQVARWTAAHFEPEQARNLVVFERLGLVPAGQTAVAKSNSDHVDRAFPGLFASPVSQADSADCGLLSKDHFQRPDDRLAAMLARGGPWIALKAIAAKVPQENIGDLTEAAWHLVCDTK